MNSTPRTATEYRTWWEQNTSIPYGYCWCGCGERTTVANRNDTRAGMVKGEPRRYLPMHHKLTQRRPAGEYRQWWEANAPVPYGFCWCRCGGRTNLATQTHSHLGIVQGQPMRYLSKHNLKPKLTPKQEAEVCRRYLAGESGRALCKAFGVADGTIYSALNRHGIKRRPNAMRGVFTAGQEQSICDRYTAGEHVPLLAEECGVTRSAIYSLLKRRGIKTRPRGEEGDRYYCDYNFFDTIDTEEKAYWLGFIAADGCAHSGASRFSVELAAEDVEHLYRLKYSLKSTHPVYFLKSGKVALSVGSSRLARALDRHGIHPRKTFSVEWPQHLPKDLLRHYLRGYADGDGCLYVHRIKDKYNARLQTAPYFSLVGNRTFVEACQRYLVDSCSLNYTKLLHKKNTNEDIVSVTYGGRVQVSRIFDLLYENASVLLLRKYYKLKFHFVFPPSPPGKFGMLLLDGEKLDALLEARGFGVGAFAGAAGLDRNSVAAILNNKRTVRPSTVAKIAHTLGVEPADLLGDSPVKKRPISPA